jgi:hypothetical protein
MDNLLRQLETLSTALLNDFQGITFEDLTDYMTEREDIFASLEQIKTDPNDKIKYKDLINRILSFDPIIVAKMEQLKDEAKKELNKVSSGRIQKNAYDGQVQSTDGIFFDQKK